MMHMTKYLYQPENRVKQRKPTAVRRSAAPGNHEAPIEHKCREMEGRSTYEEDVIIQKVKSAVQELVTTEQLSTKAEESMKHILRTSFHKAQSRIQSFI